MLKLRKKIVVLLALWLCADGGLVFGQAEKGRMWTSTDEKRIFATLLRVEGGRVVLNWKGKETKVAKRALGEEDQTYLEGFEDRMIFGEVETMEIEPSSEQEVFLSQHGVKSFRWTGRALAEDRVVPYLMAEPTVEKKQDEKVPLIIYLSGTGGIGTDNLKPLFKDANGVAQELMGKKFQRYHPCYVMIPQPVEFAIWSDIGFTYPGVGMKGVVDAVRIMLEGEDYQIDPHRIYVVGLSMGGRGAVQALAKFPKFFAAGISISGLDLPVLFSKERDNLTPLWVVINRGDGNLEKRLELFERHYRKEGGDIRTTVYEKGGHDAWNQLLADRKFKQWLFWQKVE